MGNPVRSEGLRTIFSFFLGLMLATFVGVGVYTFHPPATQLASQIRDLVRREQAIRDAFPADELTPEARNQLQDIRRQRNELDDAQAAARAPWGRSTSIILIVFATLAMAVSLVRGEQLPVISNGLLLGGVFTMLYGVGWIVVTDTTTARFVVMAGALVITLGLGYVRFVRRGKAMPGSSGLVQPGSEELVGIARRVQDLEDRMNEAAHALGQKRDGSGWA
jgi:hypothetical protein